MRARLTRLNARDHETRAGAKAASPVTVPALPQIHWSFRPETWQSPWDLLQSLPRMQQLAENLWVKNYPLGSGDVLARARRVRPISGKRRCASTVRHGRCYGFCQAGLGSTRFLVVVGCLCEVAWERPSCFLWLPNAAAASARVFEGRRAPGHLVGGVSSERFLFFLPGEAFFTPTGKLLSASGREIAAPAL